MYQHATHEVRHVTVGGGWSHEVGAINFNELSRMGGAVSSGLIQVIEELAEASVSLRGGAQGLVSGLGNGKISIEESLDMYVKRMRWG